MDVAYVVALTETSNVYSEPARVSDDVCIQVEESSAAGEKSVSADSIDVKETAEAVAETQPEQTVSEVVSDMKDAAPKASYLEMVSMFFGRIALPIRSFFSYRTLRIWCIVFVSRVTIISCFTEVIERENILNSYTSNPICQSVCFLSARKGKTSCCTQWFA